MFCSSLSPTLRRACLIALAGAAAFSIWVSSGYAQIGGGPPHAFHGNRMTDAGWLAP